MRLYKIVPFSVVIFLITLLFAGAVTVPAAAQQYDTMQFHYDATHSGDYSPVAGTIQPNNHLKWNYTTGTVSSSPAVANGIAYVGG